MTRPSQQSARLFLTAGEPAGIGPELVLKAAQGLQGEQPIVVADRGLLFDTAAQLGLEVGFSEWNPHNPPASEPGCIPVMHVPLSEPAIPGTLNPANASYVLETLRLTASFCLDGGGAGMITAPVHKGVINDAGIGFTGHTEFLAEQAGVDKVVMMLAAGDLRVALVTTHLPLRKVADSITRDTVRETIRIVNDELGSRFNIDDARIQVLGLNPHAGEGGHLGTEEIDVISPVINACAAEGINVTGPVPADTAFTKHHLENCDAVIAMYHDQGLPVLKHAGFGKSVNITLGLPFVRTSVDHGTAIDIAGTGAADEGSLLEAIEVARTLTT